MTTKEKPDRYIFAARPRCPECGSVELRAYRTTKQADGSLMRYVRCASCGRKAILVLE